jgi:hypothetical protein
LATPFQAAKEHYWEKVLKPISERYNSIVSRSDIKKIYDSDKILTAVTSIIESLIGEAAIRVARCHIF